MEFCFLLCGQALNRLRDPHIFLNCFAFIRTARLPRDVPEKAEAFLRWAFRAASDELLISVAICARLAAPDQRKASFFQAHHGADMGCWRVAMHY